MSYLNLLSDEVISIILIYFDNKSIDNFNNIKNVDNIIKYSFIIKYNNILNHYNLKLSYLVVFNPMELNMPDMVVSKTRSYLVVFKLLNDHNNYIKYVSNINLTRIMFIDESKKHFDLSKIEYDIKVDQITHSFTPKKYIFSCNR